MTWTPPLDVPLEAGFARARYTCRGCGAGAGGTPLRRFPDVTRPPTGWLSTCDNPAGAGDAWSHWCPACVAASRHTSEATP